MVARDARKRPRRPSAQSPDRAGSGRPVLPRSICLPGRSRPCSRPAPSTPRPRPSPIAPRSRAYCDATSGNVMRLAARILGHADDAAAREAGTAYALAGLLRSLAFHRARHKTYLPESLIRTVDLTPEQLFAGQGREQTRAVMAQMAIWAREHLAKARELRIPRAALPAYLPAALTPLYLRRAMRRGFDPLRRTLDLPLHRRQVRLLAAAMRGRI